MLRLKNGDSQGHFRVSAAVITLNGQQIFRPSEFNRKVSGLNRQVVLQNGENILEVNVRGEPGTHLTLELYQKDAQICRALGPQTFVRATGKPITEEIIFSLGSQLSGPFTVHLINGDPDGSHRADSGTVTLNGQVIFDSSQFNEQVEELSQVVNLQSNNTLRVHLNGAPGDRISLEITGFDNIPPQVSITSPLPGEVFSAGPISVTGIVDDPSATVTVNGIVATVAPDGTFTAEGVPLEEGQNTLVVVATDSCGNQGEDQITVQLQTTPVGPELQFCAEPFREQVPEPPGEECGPQPFGRSYGLVVGLTDETAETVTINEVLLPDGVEVFENGPIFWGLREGTFFWAFVNLPPPDGIHSFTAVATNADGQQRMETVTFLRDTIAPLLTIVSPPNGMVTNEFSAVVTGTVDDPEATVRLGFFGPQIPVINGTFEVTVSLLLEGSNRITISARDPSGNPSNKSVTIIRDTIPPVITISSPNEGAVVNLSPLTVEGTIIDSTQVNATIAVNGGTPTTLNLSGSNFNDSVPLNEGFNTIQIEAADAAGNIGSANRSVFLDTVPPIVNLTSPLPDEQLSGTVSVNVDASDASSGVTLVHLLVDGEVQGTQLIPPYSFDINTLLIPTGERTLTAQAFDLAGNSAEDNVSVGILPQVQLQIDSPADGSTINKPFTLVKGTFLMNIPEVGITVNGVLAQTYGNQFAANQVPLAEGSNTITAQATDGQGTLIESQVTVQAVTTVPYINLRADIESGVLPLTSTLTLTGTASISASSLSYTGPGGFFGPQITQISPEEFKVTFLVEGIYFFTAQATDSQSNTYTDTLAIAVLNLAELDALLKGKWEGMKTALSVGDLDTAITYFTQKAGDRYRPAFETLGTDLPQIISTFPPIDLVDLGGESATYIISRLQNNEERLYFITFSKNAQGLWKIQSF
jgi:hypothetical protein